MKLKSNLAIIIGASALAGASVAGTYYVLSKTTNSSNQDSLKNTANSLLKDASSESASGINLSVCNCQLGLNEHYIYQHNNVWKNKIDTVLQKLVEGSKLTQSEEDLVNNLKNMKG
ncbi:hypothetical protein [Mycoplasma sp. Ms02]|uniref:hypothetical protein n=1 Tax=Mycoplasma sp. Ms02 TaxID=353851 RepID=UPI0005B65E5D|nr:hypothetical protein [Mycoplasma sp. Ms02]AJN18581.1 hypothetical protein [Mycoplasma sp. Ms02]QZE12210.1 hypothetical protein K4L35_02600 [Mycoplasma sp. Ms02]